MKRTIVILAGAGLLAAAGVAIAAGMDERRENKIIGEHTEKKIALTDVPAPVMDAARTQLSAVTKAERVTTKDGRTLYEIKGKTSAGKIVELFVTDQGKILGKGS